MRTTLLAAMAAIFGFSPALAQTAQESPADQLLAQAPDGVWRTLDPENILLLDLPSGEILIEMRPDFSQAHVERVKYLARQGFYDGTIFHRVIDGFMAQGGDPTGTGRGASDLPDLQGEFVKSMREFENVQAIGRDNRSPRIGFLGALPVAFQPPTMTEFLNTEEVGLWPMHCTGVVSMARGGDPNSANSQFFIMFGDNRRSLDQSYTAWGRVIDGDRNVRRINRGEPPERPTPVLRARVMADLPPEEQMQVQVLSTESETFMAWLEETRQISEDGYFDDVCNVRVPVRIEGEIKS
jgi:peptidylprolyl isomerase